MICSLRKPSDISNLLLKGKRCRAILKQLISVSERPILETCFSFVSRYKAGTTAPGSYPWENLVPEPLIFVLKFSLFFGGRLEPSCDHRALELDWTWLADHLKGAAEAVGAVATLRESRLVSARNEGKYVFKNVRLDSGISCWRMGVEGMAMCGESGEGYRHFWHRNYFFGWNRNSYEIGRNSGIRLGFGNLVAFCLWGKSIFSPNPEGAMPF